MSQSVEHVKENGLTRRSAIGRLAAIGSAGFMVASGLSSDLLASTGDKDGVQRLEYAQWKALIGQKFYLREWSGYGPTVSESTTFVLEEVSERSYRDVNRPAELRPAALSLLFSSNRTIDSASYIFENAKFGRSPLLASATVRADREHQLIYEVILN